MADELIQYPPDQPFPGAIGRTVETSTPAWPARPEAPDGAPNVVVIVLDDVGYGQLSPFGGLCETPNLDRLAERGLRFSNFHTTALVLPDPGLPADRPQPPHARPVGHHRDVARLPGPQRHHGLRARLPLRDAGGGTATTPSRSASGTSPRRPRPPRPARTTGGRSVGASSATTGSWAATPTSGTPTSPTTTTRCASRPRRRRATTSTPTWPTTPSTSSRTPTPTRPTSRSSSGSPPAPVTRPTRSSPSGSNATPARSTWGGTSTAASCSNASWRSGSLPAGHRALRARPRRRGRGTS